MATNFGRWEQNNKKFEEQFRTTRSSRFRVRVRWSGTARSWCVAYSKCFKRGPLHSDVDICEWMTCYHTGDLNERIYQREGFGDVLNSASWIRCTIRGCPFSEIQ